jgi:hypothetical protein
MLTDVDARDIVLATSVDIAMHVTNVCQNKLNYYRRGGDSLQGRYHYYHMFPFREAHLLREARFCSLEIRRESGEKS